MTWWLRQLAVYIIVLAIMKSIILAFFWIPLIFDFGDWLLSWMKEDVKIVFVLMIFPLLMNAFQVRQSISTVLGPGLANSRGSQVLAEKLPVAAQGFARNMIE